MADTARQPQLEPQTTTGCPGATSTAPFGDAGTGDGLMNHLSLSACAFSSYYPHPSPCSILHHLPRRILLLFQALAQHGQSTRPARLTGRPVFLSTWNFGNLVDRSLLSRLGSAPKNQRRDTRPSTGSSKSQARTPATITRIPLLSHPTANPRRSFLDLDRLKTALSLLSPHRCIQFPITRIHTPRRPLLFSKI